MVKKDKYEIWAIAFLICFTFFIFGPLEFYMISTGEASFYFGISNILGWCLIWFVLSSIVLVVIQSIGKKIISAILFAIGVGVYVQGNYINPNYGVLNGSEIDWTIYRTYAWGNSFFWIAIIIISIIASIKAKPEVIKKIQVYISVFIISIEIITLGTLLITNYNEVFVESADGYITDKEQFVVGSEENIILILLDTFDSDVFEEIMGKDSEVKSELKDFTYYKNMTGGYPYTAFAVSLILTGEWYDRERPWEAFVVDSSANNEIYEQLIDKNYSIGLYGNESLMGTEPLIGKVRNIADGKAGVSSKRAVTNTMIRLTAFRYFPHILKKYTSYTDVDFYKYMSEECYKIDDDVFFYNKLKNERISTENCEKAFIYYHLNGIHAPYIYDENVTTEESTEDKQGRGALKIVYEYIEQLKEIGVYDNSTIVVFADHGYKGMGQNPLFLVKEANANHEFEVDMSPVSYDDLQGTYTYWITGEKGNKSTIYDFEEKVDRVRYFRYYPLHEQKNEEVPFVEYAIYGDAWDENSMLKTGYLYGKEGKYYSEKLKYEPGLVISFDAEGNYEKFIETGFRNFGGWIYSFENSTRFSMDMSNYQGGDLKIEIALANVLTPPQRLRLFVNDNYVDEMVANVAGDTLIYHIPEEYLNNDITTFKIEYPDVLVNGEGIVEGHTDSGLAVVFYSIKIDDYVQ